MPLDVIRVSAQRERRLSFLLSASRDSGSETKSTSLAEKCPGGEQKADRCPTLTLIAPLFSLPYRCFVHGPILESSRDWSSISPDGIVLRGAAEFLPSRIPNSGHERKTDLTGLPTMLSTLRGGQSVSMCSTQDLEFSTHRSPDPCRTDYQGEITRVHEGNTKATSATVVDRSDS